MFGTNWVSSFTLFKCEFYQSFIQTKYLKLKFSIRIEIYYEYKIPT